MPSSFSVEGKTFSLLFGVDEKNFFLKGLIDPVKELTKLEKKQEQLRGVVTKLSQSMAASDYEVKVPEEVRVANADKLKQTEIELERVTDAMAVLKLL